MNALKNSINIGITGLGLIGGSLYKNLIKNGFCNICVHTSNTETKAIVEQDGFIASNKTNVLEKCDIIFVCSPISETVNSVKKFFNINSDAIFVDVASLKANILSEIEQIPDCKFIGSHPMAGTENSGFKNAFPELFNGAIWVLTPSKNAKENDIELLEKLISVTGATPITMNAVEHDKTVALISHMPMLLSQSLMQSVVDNDNAKTLASSGFRDMTRLALSNKMMAKDMLNFNKENIQNALKLVVEEAEKLLNSDYFNENIDNIIEIRRNLYNTAGKNNFRNNN